MKKLSFLKFYIFGRRKKGKETKKKAVKFTGYLYLSNEQWLKT